MFQEDTEKLLVLAKEINDNAPPQAKVEDLDEDLITQMGYNAMGDMCPMQAVIGGITAQEVMKVRDY